MNKYFLLIPIIFCSCASEPEVNQNLESQIYTIDRFVDFAFNENDSQNFLITYKPLIENGKLRRYLIDENGDSLLAEMKEHNELRKSLISNFLVPNQLSLNQLSKSKHTFINSNQSIDSAIRATDLYYLGELGISEVTEDSKSLLYVEVISPDHLKGVSRFILLNKTDSGWNTVNTFSAWQLSSDSTNFLIQE